MAPGGHGSFAAAEALAHAGQRLAQTFGADRLQQVVDRVHLECADRVLVVGGREDHRHVAADQVEHLEAVELRHLDVEEQQVGRQLRHGLHRLEAVGALRHDLDVRFGGQVLAEDRPRQRLVVHDGDAQRKRVWAQSSKVQGRSIATRNPVGFARCVQARGAAEHEGQPLADVLEPDAAALPRQGVRIAGVLHGDRQTVAAARDVQPDRAAVDHARDAVRDGVLEQRLQDQRRHPALERALVDRRSTCRRAPKRTCSMPRNRSASASSSASVMLCCVLTRSVVRRNSASSTHIRRAAAGSLPVSALMEFRLL